LADALVARTFGMDFIYFDLIFIAIWLYLLIKKKYWVPIFWGLLGWVAYIIADYVIWYLLTHTRHYSGPLNPFVFFMWFCFSPGFVQFSYVIVMFEKRNRNELIFWTSLLYLGWTAVALGSQLIPLDDRIIIVYRDMNVLNQRIIEVSLVLVNVIVAIFLYLKKKLRLEDIAFLFVVGTLVELALEFTLSVSNIRQAQGSWSIVLLIINSLIEFNLGIVLMYLLWAIFKVKRYKHYYYQLSYMDLNHIKTDFDGVASICRNQEINERYIQKYMKLYSRKDFLSDIQYYCKSYLPNSNMEELIIKIKKIWV
jgi:hypothetical protein